MCTFSGDVDFGWLMSGGFKLGVGSVDGIVVVFCFGT